MKIPLEKVLLQKVATVVKKNSHMRLQKNIFAYQSCFQCSREEAREIIQEYLYGDDEDHLSIEWFINVYSFNLCSNNVTDFLRKAILVQPEDIVTWIVGKCLTIVIEEYALVEPTATDKHYLTRKANKDRMLRFISRFNTKYPKWWETGLGKEILFREYEINRKRD